MKNNQPIVKMPKQFKPQVTIQEERNINKRTISKITKIKWDSDSDVISKSWCSKQCATHTNICTQGKLKDIFSDYYEVTKEENTKKNALKLSFNLF